MRRFSRFATFAALALLAGMSNLLAQSKPQALVELEVHVFTCSRDALAETRLEIAENVAHKIAHLSARECSALEKTIREHKSTKILTEPRIVTLSGNPVKVLNGDRVPVILAGGKKSTFDVGLAMTLLPTMHELGNICLEMTPTVVSVDQTMGITVAGDPVPGFSEKTVKLAIDLNSDQCAGLSLNVDATGSTTKNRVTLILVKQIVSPDPTPSPSAAATQASHSDRAKKIAAMLVEEYHAACRDQNNELAVKLARQALELDPTCFNRAATPSATGVSR